MGKNYGAKSGGGYGGQSRKSGGFGKFGKGKKGGDGGLSAALKNFRSRSKQAQAQDLMKIATLAPNIEVYLEHPERYDFPGVDIPAEQQNIIDSLCAATCKSKTGGADIVIKDKQKKTEKRVRVVKTEDKNAELEKAANEVEQTAKKQGRQLPTKEEIFARAVEIWRQDNGYLDNVANPDETELREEGFLNKAKVELMTSEAGQGKQAFGDYIDQIRRDLNAAGFDIIPLGGGSLADVADVDDSKWADYLETQ